LVSCPGKKAFALPKKALVSLSYRGFLRFRLAIPWPPRLFAEAKKREKRRLLPSLLWLRRPLSCPGNKKTGLSDRLIWRRFFFSPRVFPGKFKTSIFKKIDFSFDFFLWFSLE
jgi:hypothetical protein